MGQFYEVQFANPLEGTDSHHNVTYSVKFTTEADSVLWKVQPTTVVQPGTKVFGRIETLTSQRGKPYRKFTREQQDQQPGTGYSKPAGSFQKGGNSDGMRQGMCINNASAYVNATTGEEKFVNPTEWAKAVFAYANALYALGDLGQKQEDTVATTEEVDSATDASILKDIQELGF